MQRGAVIYVGRQVVKDATRNGFYVRDYFTLSIDGVPLTSSQHDIGSYTENCQAEGAGLGDIMIDIGVKLYRIQNEHVVTPVNAVQLARPMPEDGVKELERTLSKKGLEISPNGN